LIERYNWKEKFIIALKTENATHFDTERDYKTVNILLRHCSICCAYMCLGSIYKLIRRLMGCNT